jgi:hypothetical protein
MDTIFKVLQLLPYAIKIINSIEEAFASAGKTDGYGVEKLEALKTILQSVYDKIEDIWPTMEKAVAAIVAIFNKFGLFTSDDEAETDEAETGEAEVS